MENKYCLQCNKEIKKRKEESILQYEVKKFCSRSCSAKINNKKRRKILLCINCGKELIGNKKYCSHKCQRSYEYTTFIKNWKENKESGLSGEYSLSEYIRRYLLDKYDNKCSKCGWNEINQYTNKIPLEVEHIDGNYLNNKEENLTLLCPNCHSLTKTYKGANIGQGRKSRSKYKLYYS